MMNKFPRLVLLCFIILFFNGCSQNDEDTIEDNSISGKWELVSWSIKTPVDLNNDGIATTEFSPGCLAGSYFEFEDDLNWKRLYQC